MDGNLNELLSTDSNFEGILVYGWLETASIKKEIERSDLLYVMEYNKNKNIEIRRREKQAY